MSEELTFFLQLLVNGVLNGCLYAIVGLGLVLIWKASDVLNFAHGEAVTLGAYLGIVLAVQMAVPYPLAFLLTVVGAGAAGMLVVRFPMRPFLGSQPVTIIIATVALGIMFKNVMRLIWQDHVQAMPPVFGAMPFEIAGVFVSPEHLWVASVTVLLSVAVLLFVQRTRIGQAMRAVSQNREAAGLMGIRVQRVLDVAWAIGTALGGVAGVLIAPMLGVTPEMGLILISGFAGAIVGGFNSLVGALVGGVLVGVVENLAGGYVSSTFKSVIAFLLIIVVLMVRPQGLLAARRLRAV